MVATSTLAAIYLEDTKMNRPRHHTLQGICQDVCVNYQQVVEVLRRIRQVCLEENGTVITQDAGTFFCRNVQGRSGVLNGKPWTSESFIELGLKGERIVGEHVDPPRTAERVSFTLNSGFIGDSVFGNLFGGTFFPFLDFSDEDSTIFGLTRIDAALPIPIDQQFADRNSVDAGDLQAGFNDVEISLELADNKASFFLESLTTAESIFQVNDTPLAIGDMVSVDVNELVRIVIDPAFFDLRPMPNNFDYRISYTFVSE